MRRKYYDKHNSLYETRNNGNYNDFNESYKPLCSSRLFERIMLRENLSPALALFLNNISEKAELQIRANCAEAELYRIVGRQYGLTYEVGTDAAGFGTFRTDRYNHAGHNFTLLVGKNHKLSDLSDEQKTNIINASADADGFIDAFIKILSEKPREAILDQGAYSKLTGNIDGDAKQLLVTYFSNNQKKISSNLAQIKLKALECRNIPNGARIYMDFVESKVEQALLVA